MLRASSLPGIAWDDGPAGSDAVVWRYPADPIIDRHATPTSNSIFNSAVVPFRGICAGTLLDGDTGRIAIYYGAADTVTGLAFGYVSEIVDFVKANSL